VQPAGSGVCGSPIDFDGAGVGHKINLHAAVDHYVSIAKHLLAS
jgi:hypothetical protein